ncbi:TetR/AcrR family transcriptional regulator [Clostridium sp. PL3]|uniref:TetR/AcrR family transcriptional regulator n=1 Tax=Clostridium thailandense TaxID=2794346 RepID=A0A949TZL8_9CLOT|nr:TetR/AcrR family transcriptional regulator [Clostridium thailandense]MBV7276596.1 TetR/AcrR family transcriptional regulator [Clostridium thailandense]
MESKDMIMEAAKKLFFEKGYNKTTTREIAETANVNLGLIPYYFKKKGRIAQIIYDNLIDDLFNLEDLKIFECTNSIERLFMSLILIHKRFLENKSYSKFYLELIYDDIVTSKPHKYTISIIEEIIDEFNIKVSEADLYNYMIIIKGAERSLIKKKLENKLRISYVEINKLLVLNNLLLLGIDRKLIDQSLDNCITTIKNHGLFDDLFK